MRGEWDERKLVKEREEQRGEGGGKRRERVRGQRRRGQKRREKEVAERKRGQI